MGVLRSVVGGGRKDNALLQSLTGRAAVGVFAVALLCACAALTLVDWNVSEPDSPASSTGMSVLESAGMDSVLRAKDLADRRQRAYLKTQEDVQKMRLALSKAQDRETKMSNTLDDLDRDIHSETVKMSKDAAKAEADGDSANELILKAREHEHNAKSHHRHAETALRREKREQGSLGSFTKEAAKLKAKAASELKDAHRREAKAEQLRRVARKHLEDAATLKRQIRDVLQHKMNRLSDAIDASQRAAVRATERAKAADKDYARLKQAAGVHDNAARLAQRRADQAALQAEAADKAAAQLAIEVSAELSIAQKDKDSLARLLTSASNPEGSTTLRTAIPEVSTAKTLESHDVSLGPNAAAAKPSHDLDSKAARELRAAADQIRKLRAEKAAAERRAAAERKAEEELEKSMRKNSAAQKRVVYTNHPASKRPAPKEMENNFEAAMNYLNNEHLDSATGVDDHGRDAVGRPAEGRRAFVGVLGRSPQLDAMATANLRQYQEDESELDKANFSQDDSPVNRNIF